MAEMVVGHIKPRWQHPELTWEPTNWQVECKDCSNKSGQRAVIEKAMAAGAAAERARLFSDRGEAPKARPLTISLHETDPVEFEVPDRLKWDNPAQHEPEWMRGAINVPDDASPPLAMTPPHPRAVGSYGLEAINWVREETGVELRWWQKLAFMRQLEHDEDGELVWKIILESGPRRVGKSVRLRAGALWPIDQEELFGEPQLAIHTGMNVAIVREIHQKAWTWATMRDGWRVTRGAGQQEVIKGDNRWLVRAADAVYGYDVCLGMVDEAWGVKPESFTEGLEPATLERISPQLLLTSTAHRLASGLMPNKLSAALNVEDGETLVLLWGAPPGSDVGDPAIWRAASPHWSPGRAKMVEAKYLAALAGVVDPDAEDSDPMAGFIAQYLNMWTLKVTKQEKGNTVVTEAAWETLASPLPPTAPQAAAIESWYQSGVSLALAWPVPGGGVVVSVTDHADLSEAALALKTARFRRVATVGASLLDDPALKGVRTKKGQVRTVAAVQDLERLIADGTLRHDGGAHLGGQVLAARTLPSADGLRMASTERADAIKAAVWAIADCRKTPVGRPRIIVAS
ncbi:HNH endonuclease [Kribbella sp. NPDC051770]|uniref:HNH endonuclease n=1 Tax=Kribbella sp. NPDC051770 TaxID=3155413 RepID=UPI0034473F0C